MNKYRSIVSSAFAILVLFSSSSFMVGIHLCSGHIQDIAWLAPAEKCAMEKQMPPCHKKEAKPCCEDQTVMHESQDFKGNGNEINLAQLVAFIISQPWIIVANLTPPLFSVVNNFTDYDPPATFTDRTIVLQTFLI
jgi:hypothetical protein